MRLVINKYLPENEIRDEVIKGVVPAIVAALQDAGNGVEFEALVKNIPDSSGNCFGDFSTFAIRKVGGA